MPSIDQLFFGWRIWHPERQLYVATLGLDGVCVLGLTFAVLTLWCCWRDWQDQLKNQLNAELKENALNNPS